MDKNKISDKPIFNRKEKRNMIRNLVGRKGYKKKATKGAFGELPKYLRKDIPPMVDKNAKDVENHNIEENKKEGKDRENH